MASPKLTSLLDIFAAPNQVFDRIRNFAISFWLPLVVMVVAMVAVTGWYFLTVDMV
jgi:hypothetical protein